MNSSTNVIASLTDALDAGKKAWSDEIGDESTVETFEDYVGRLFSAFKGVILSKDIKKALKSAGSNAVTSVGEVSHAASITTKKINEQLSTSEEWKQANADVSKEAQNLLALTIATGKRLIGIDKLSNRKDKR